MRGDQLASAAHEALKRGEQNQARLLFAEAADAEAFAFRQIPPSKPRTRGILAVSAASLWYKARDLVAAERFAHEAFSISNLPDFARQELRELLQSIWNEEAQNEAGVSFAAGQVLISVKGGEVVTGGAPLDLILGKVQVVQNLFYRTVEYMINAPLRLRGPAAKGLQERYRPWLFQSVPGSYQFSVAVQKSSQPDLFADQEIQPELLAEKFLEIIRACSEEPEVALREVITKPEYRRTFLRMTRSLAPSGKAFSQMEIRGAGDSGTVVLSSESRKIISQILRPEHVKMPSDESEIILHGNLRALDLDKDWLEVSVKDETMRVSGLSEAVDDVIGPMVNHDVTVRVRRGRGKQLLFVDIEQDD